MNSQVIEAQPDGDADALAAFERMNGQLAMLTAAVEGFAARQTRIEQRDYSQDLRSSPSATTGRDRHSHAGQPARRSAHARQLCRGDRQGRNDVARA